MWAYAAATLRDAWRSPMSWVLLGIGVFLGWFATIAAILALDEVGRQAVPLTFSTAHLGGALLAVWLIARSTDADRHSGFAAAADATRAGHHGRALGRWAGACCAGLALSLLTAVLITLAAGLAPPPGPSLLSTSIQVITVVGAWAVLLGVVWRGAGVMLLAVVLYVLGHLPWGTHALLNGAPGLVIGALLPGPRSSETIQSLGYTSAAAAGLLLVSLAWSRPADR